MTGTDMCDHDLKDYVLFTRFVGYDRGFYYAMPYEKESLVINRSFSHLEKLHTQ